MKHRAAMKYDMVFVQRDGSPCRYLVLCKDVFLVMCRSGFRLAGGVVIGDENSSVNFVGIPTWPDGDIGLSSQPDGLENQRRAQGAFRNALHRLPRIDQRVRRDAINEYLRRHHELSTLEEMGSFCDFDAFVERLRRFSEA